MYHKILSFGTRNISELCQRPKKQTYNLKYKILAVTIYILYSIYIKNSEKYIYHKFLSIA